MQASMTTMNPQENKKIIFRNDDVNPNSNLDDIRAMYALLKKHIPNVEIYSCVNLLAQENDNGSAYKEFKPVDIDFYSVDKVFDLAELPTLENIVSHGLFHLDHKHTTKEVQEVSIRASCEILKTKTFIPPFWRWNIDTKVVCDSNGITLWTEPAWINFDNEIDGFTGDYYLFHSWKFTVESFEKKLLDDIKKHKN